MRRSCQYLNI